jgi:hypothetical protein
MTNFLILIEWRWQFKTPNRRFATTFREARRRRAAAVFARCMDNP